MVGCVEVGEVGWWLGWVVMGWVGVRWGGGWGGRWWCCCWCWVVVVVVGEYVAGWGREDAGMMRGWASGDVMWWCGGGVEAW